MLSIVLYATEPAIPTPLAEPPKPAAMAIIVPSADALTSTAPTSVKVELAMYASVSISSRLTVTAPARPSDLFSLDDQAKPPETAMSPVASVALTSTPPTSVRAALLIDASVRLSSTLTETLPDTAMPYFWPPWLSWDFSLSLLSCLSSVFEAATVALMTRPSLFASIVVLPPELIEPPPTESTSRSSWPVPVATVPSRSTIVVSDASV